MANDLIVRGFTGGIFSENCFLVSCVGSGRGIIVDPGAAIGELLRVAEEAELSIEAIVLTHAHIDHIDGAAEAKRRTGAPIVLHRADEELYGAAALQAQWFGVELESPPPIDRFYEAGDRVEFGSCHLDVRFTPGHAAGHVILVGEGLALVGDCVFAGSIGRTDLPGGDFQTLIRSIRTEILTLPDETTLYPGHGPTTTVGHERASNPFLVPQLGGSSFA